MLKVKRWVVLVLFFMVPEASSAGDHALVQGVWKLVSYEVEMQSTGKKEFPMGRKPTGYVLFTAEGRVFFILTGEGRKPAKTVQERADLLNSLVSYAGSYRLEKDMWITHVEVAWDPEWIGTEQARSYEVDGDRLQVLTPWRVMPNWREKGMTSSIITFERVK